MSVVKRAMLLLLAALCTDAAPTAEECDGVNKTLPTKDLHTVFGDWVLVWAVSDNHYISDVNLSSSHVEMRSSPDNKTILYTERNLFFNNTCSLFLINILMPSDPTDADHHTLITTNITVERDGVVGPYESGSLDFYESRPDSMLMVYNSSKARFLLIYRREGQHQDVEQLKAAENNHKKLAECLGFPHDQPFIYDGAADFCHKKSSPAAAAET